MGRDVTVDLVCLLLLLSLLRLFYAMQRMGM